MARIGAVREDSNLAGLIAALLLIFVGGAGPADSADLAGWEQTRWGMSTSELDALYGSRLRRLDPPLRYGNAYVDRALAGVDLGGFPYVAQFQMDAGAGHLQQVLLERRRAGVTPKAFGAALQALESAYGPADLVCDSPRRGAESSPIGRERVWRLPTTTIHLSFLDFLGGVMLYDPSRDIDPRVPDVPLYAPRSFPRKLLIRFHPTARSDLMGRDCPPP